MLTWDMHGLISWNVIYVIVHTYNFSTHRVTFGTSQAHVFLDANIDFEWIFL